MWFLIACLMTNVPSITATSAMTEEEACYEKNPYLTLRVILDTISIMGGGGGRVLFIGSDGRDTTYGRYKWR